MTYNVFMTQNIRKRHFNNLWRYFWLNNVLSGSSSSLSSSLMSVRDVKITSRASLKCPFRGHSIITPSLGRQCLDLEWHLKTGHFIQTPDIFVQFSNDWPLTFKNRTLKCPVFKWFQILKGQISDPRCSSIHKCLGAVQKLCNIVTMGLLFALLQGIRLRVWSH